MKFYTLLLGAIFYTISAVSQNMQDGFAMLEKGDFAGAETFFERILQTYPNNKTANICYGRAVGLHSSPEKATQLFTRMLNEYPNDLEVELNYAESLLWGKQFEKAETVYAGLTEKHPDNFAALLGYANTFSNLKKYTEALTYVNKALAVQPGNANAMVSKKYIRLGYAYQLSQNQRYKEAEALLLENLHDFPGDKDILRNLANLYLVTKETDKATETYRKMATSAKDSIEALNGIALAAHIAEENKTALELAILSQELMRGVQDSILERRSKERYIQALVWNRKFALAKQHIDSAFTTYPNENWVFALHATLGMYTSNIKQSLNDYRTILHNDTSSFDGNLGIANAYFAYGDIDKAYEAAEQTLEIFANQKDAMQFIKKLDAAYTPSLQEKLSFSFDNGKNTAATSLTSLEFPVSTRFSFIGYYQYRVANGNEKRSAMNNAEAGFSYRIHPKVRLQATGGISAVNSYSTRYQNGVANVLLKIDPFKLQNLELGFKSEMQNYNADLINSEIQTNHMFLNYNLSTNFKLGWFTQYYFTTQSDDNVRNLLFTSLYYNILSKPVLKTGFNYQYITFKNQVPTMYFSPANFNSVEIFVDLLKDANSITTKGFYYGLSAAAGYQFIEELPKDPTFRFHLTYGYKVSDRFAANAYAMHSNIASTTAAGYNYTEFGVQLKWLILEKPVFRKQ